MTRDVGGQIGSSAPIGFRLLGTVRPGVLLPGCLGGRGFSEGWLRRWVRPLSRGSDWTEGSTQVSSEKATSAISHARIASGSRTDSGNTTASGSFGVLKRRAALACSAPRGWKKNGSSTGPDRLLTGSNPRVIARTSDDHRVAEGQRPLGPDPATRLARGVSCLGGTDSGN